MVLRVATLAGQIFYTQPDQIISRGLCKLGYVRQPCVDLVATTASNSTEYTYIYLLCFVTKIYSVQQLQLARTRSMGVTCEALPLLEQPYKVEARKYNVTVSTWYLPQLSCGLQRAFANILLRRMCHRSLANQIQSIPLILLYGNIFVSRKR